MHKCFTLVLLAVGATRVAAGLFDERTLRMPLDHFSYATNRTFELRYFVNDTFYKLDLVVNLIRRHGGPLLFYPGGAAPLESFANIVGA